MEKTRREQKREDTIDEIKTIARQLMSEGGTAALSMRPIAAQMKMSVMGLYRYFENRDALITALVADNFNALADALEAARDNEPSGDPRHQFRTVMLAYRGWAVEHPVDFQLNYGNPIPGYVAPREITVPAAVRSFTVIIGLIEEMFQRGFAVPKPPYDSVPASMEPQVRALIEQNNYPVSTLALYLGVVGWGQLHGVIMLELFHHIQAVVGDSAVYYAEQVEYLMQMLDIKT